MRCEKCGARIRGEAFGSPLGERVCAGCHDQIAGAVLGIESGGGLGTAIALAGSSTAEPNGVLAWIRRALGRGPS